MASTITVIAMHPREARNGEGDAVTFSIDGRLVRYEVWTLGGIAGQDAYDADDEHISLAREYGEHFNETLLTAYSRLLRLFSDRHGARVMASTAAAMTEAVQVFNAEHSAQTSPEPVPTAAPEAITYPALLKTISQATGVTPFKADNEIGGMSQGVLLDDGRVLTIATLNPTKPGLGHIAEVLRFGVRSYPSWTAYQAHEDYAEVASVPLDLQALDAALRSAAGRPEVEPRYSIVEVPEGDVIEHPWLKPVAVLDADNGVILAYADPEGAALIVDALRKAHRAAATLTQTAPSKDGSN